MTREKCLDLIHSWPSKRKPRGCVQAASGRDLWWDCRPGFELSASNLRRLNKGPKEFIEHSGKDFG